MKKTKGWDYFDDCVICQAMEKAEKRGKDLSLEELRKAFAKVNKKRNKLIVNSNGE